MMAPMRVPSVCWNICVLRKTLGHTLGVPEVRVRGRLRLLPPLAQRQPPAAVPARRQVVPGGRPDQEGPQRAVSGSAPGRLGLGAVARRSRDLLPPVGHRGRHLAGEPAALSAPPLTAPQAFPPARRSSPWPNPGWPAAPQAGASCSSPESTHSPLSRICSYMASGARSISPGHATAPWSTKTCANCSGSPKRSKIPVK